jgi:drug/metabolite transporter (DMT)-like permease
VSIVLALLAACANAVSNVLQRKANREQPDELTMHLSLIAKLVRQPAWLGGILAVMVSFVLMVAALKMGDLATVEPLIVLELPLTVLLAARLFNARLRRREWSAIGAMTAGLAGIIAFLAPNGGTGGNATESAWVIATGTTLLVVAVLIGLGRKARAARRPTLLGVAAGVTFGLTAAFMKGMTPGLAQGFEGVFVRWQTYAMVIAGLGAMYLVQHALHAGRLVASQPGITLADPLVAILWGALVFNERFRHGALFLALAAISALVMAAASIALARSPLLQEPGAVTEVRDPVPPASPAREDERVR